MKPLPFLFCKLLSCTEGNAIKDKNGIYQVEKLLYTGDMGGILCAIQHELETEVGEEQKFGMMIISITHLKVDSANPLAARIKQYQKKRTLSIAIANSGTRRAAAKPKRNKRGFGS